VSREKRRKVEPAKTSESGKMIRHVSVYDSGDGEFHVERADGSMTIALSKEDALAAVKADDSKLAKRFHVIVITHLTWYPPVLVTEPES